MSEINNIFDKLEVSISGNSFDKFARYYLELRIGQKERVVDNLYQRKLIPSKSSNPSVNQDILRISTILFVIQ